MIKIEQSTQRPQLERPTTGRAAENMREMKRQGTWQESPDIYCKDPEYIDFIKETTPNLASNEWFYGTLMSRKSDILKDCFNRKGGYGFDDCVAASAAAYASLYREIVEGYENGTRVRYAFERDENGNGPYRRTLSMEEELEKLDKAFERLVGMDELAINCSRIYAENQRRYHHAEPDRSFHVYNENQEYDYVRNTYQKIRSCYREQFKQYGKDMDIRALVFSVLENGNHGLWEHCRQLYGTVKPFSCRA